MRRLRILLWLALCATAGASTTPFTANMQSMVGGSSPRSWLRLTIQGCGTYLDQTTSPASIVVPKPVLLYPNAQGLITANIIDESTYICGGAVGTAFYRIEVNYTDTSGATIHAASANYDIAGSGTFNLNTATPKNLYIGPGGAPGPPGAAGSTWYNSTGAPLVGLGINGDYYLDQITANVYQKQSGNWVLIANIKGQNGANGAPGAQGPAGGSTNWRGAWNSGTSYVASTYDSVSYLGSSYVAVVNNTNSAPPNSNWQLLAQAGATGSNGTNGTNGTNGLNGLNGATWFNQAGVPSNGTGVNGDYDINTSNSDVYNKIAGVWALVGNIKGATGAAGTNGTNGATWFQNTGVPGSGVGLDNDLYLNTANGDVYQKQTGAWVLIGNFRGPAGTGTVNGPGSTTANVYTLWNNTTGTLLKSSGCLSESGSLITSTCNLSVVDLTISGLLNTSGPFTLVTTWPGSHPPVSSASQTRLAIDSDGKLVESISGGALIHPHTDAFATAPTPCTSSLLAGGIDVNGNSINCAPGGTSGANVNLSNLSSTSVNADLLPSLDATRHMGSASKRWLDGIFSAGVATGSAAIPTFGGLTFVPGSAPSTPGASLLDVYALTSGRLNDKDSSGIVGTTVVPKTAATHKVFTVLSTLGVLTDTVIDSSWLSDAANLFTTSTIAPTLDAPFFCADAGSTDDYTCAVTPAVANYLTGTHFRFKANTANTGAATFTITGSLSGTKTIKKVAGGITTDLADNDIRAGQWVEVAFDGTNFQMLSQLGNAATGGTVPTGTGFTHITSGAQDSAARAVDVSSADATGVLAAARFPAQTGDVTNSSGSLATTIANLAVTNAKIAAGTIDLTTKVTGVLPLANMAQLFVTNAQTATYQVLAADFTACKTIPVASGTFTITLVASGSQPASGQCIDIINYGSGTVTVARSGQNINGAASNLTLAAGSASAPLGLHVVSDGTNYFAQTWGTGAAGGVTSLTGDSVIHNNSGSTGAVTLTLTNAAANSVLGNPTGSPAAPSYTANPSVTTNTSSGQTKAAGYIDTSIGYLTAAMTQQTTATCTNVTNMTWNIAASTKYKLHCEVPVTFVASATLAVCLGGPGTATSFTLLDAFDVSTGALNQYLALNQTAWGTKTTASAAPGAVTRVVHVDAMINNGATASGTALTLQTAANGTNGITVLADSLCQLTQVN